MFSTVRAIIIVRLKTQGYHGVALRKQIFLRTYKQDFPPETLNKIFLTLFDKH